MTEEPIIKARQKKFLESYNYKRLEESKAFELFSNYSILLQHQPDAFSADSELLDTISVGGGHDGAIDGIAIKINDCLIKTKGEIEDFLDRERLSIEFIFIQSKDKQNISCNEITSFQQGIRSFFNEDSKMPFNDSVVFWRDLKNFIYSDDVVCQWKTIPIIRCYYVTLGQVLNNEQRDDSIQTFKNDMSKICSDLYFNVLGALDFRKILDQNENKFTVFLPCVDTMELPSVSGVDNSCIALCQANDYVNLLKTEDGIIRKSLFNDNVRDYQGENTVNTEIQETANNTPEKFVLFNNGITIVCSSFLNNNRKLKIEDPQIINGCQTSNVLYNAYNSGVNINEVDLVVKVIATKNMELSNEIVRGANRQNIVMEEAFEGTKAFHKDLESFMNEYVSDFPEKIHYERRAKQYANNPSIKQYQKINLKILTQYFVGVYLRKPYLSHLHESVLLKKFNGKIFNEKDSKLPYFALSYAFYSLEKLFMNSIIDSYYRKYKAHILMIYFIQTGGKVPDLKNDRSADKYADTILKNLYKMDTMVLNFKKAVSFFAECKRIWVNDLSKNAHAIKDTPAFTELLIKRLENVSMDLIINKMTTDSKIYCGVIQKIIYKGSCSYGFIQSDNGNYYFSKRRNPRLDFKCLKDKPCEFQLSLEDCQNRTQAFNVKLLSNQMV